MRASTWRFGTSPGASRASCSTWPGRRARSRCRSRRLPAWWAPAARTSTAPFRASPRSATSASTAAESRCCGQTSCGDAGSDEQHRRCVMRGIGCAPVRLHAGRRRRSREMSDNYHEYVRKMAQVRAALEENRPLYLQLIELLQFVLECEAAWLD